jgi:hypothetical protein
VEPSNSVLEMVTRLEADVPATKNWRPMRDTLQWSIQTRSLPARVRASPPQMYWGFSSVMWIFL